MLLTLHWLSCTSYSPTETSCHGGWSSRSARVTEWLSGCEWLLRFREPCCTSTHISPCVPRSSDRLVICTGRKSKNWYANDVADFPDWWLSGHQHRTRRLVGQDWQCISQGSDIVSNIFETKSPNSAVLLLCYFFFVLNIIKYVKFHAKDGPRRTNYLPK